MQRTLCYRTCSHILVFCVVVGMDDALCTLWVHRWHPSPFAGAPQETSSGHWSRRCGLLYLFIVYPSHNAHAPCSSNIFECFVLDCIPTPSLLVEETRAARDVVTDHLLDCHAEQNGTRQPHVACAALPACPCLCLQIQQKLDMVAVLTSENDLLMTKAGVLTRMVAGRDAQVGLRCGAHCGFGKHCQ